MYESFVRDSVPLGQQHSRPSQAWEIEFVQGLTMHPRTPHHTAWISLRGGLGLGYSQSLGAGRQAGDSMELLAGDSEVVLLVALAGWRHTPSASKAPGQGEQQSEQQQGPWPHFPRDPLGYFIVARCRHILSALCPTLEETRVQEGKGGRRRAPRGCDLIAGEHAGKEEGEALKCSACLGNSSSKQACLLHFISLAAPSVPRHPTSVPVSSPP